MIMPILAMKPKPNQDIELNIYFMAVIKELHLEFEDFFYKVKEKQPYETQVYLWIKKAYVKKRSVKEAISFVHQRRIAAYISNISLDEEE